MNSVKKDNKLSFPIYFSCVSCKRRLYESDKLYMLYDSIFCSYSCRNNHFKI